MSENTKVENLLIEIFDDRQSLGAKAAKEVSEEIKKVLETKDEVRMIFAAAPSQDDLLSGLKKTSDIEWSKVVAFHMDEYLGIDKCAPQAFGQFLRDRLFDKVPFKEVNYIETSELEIDKICEEYSAKLKSAPIDIVCMGIGENGHIAFNDPPYANFNDPELVKIVELDEVSRQQQVHDGCFATIDEVPKKAITLTIPALFSGKRLFVVVPSKTKAEAVRRTLQEEITETCPASILREHKNAKLYLDPDSASLINS